MRRRLLLGLGMLTVVVAVVTIGMSFVADAGPLYIAEHFGLGEGPALDGAGKYERVSDWLADTAHHDVHLEEMASETLHVLLPSPTSVASQCGSAWQQRYAALHADIVAGRRPPKFLVYRCANRHAGPGRTSAFRGCGGLGNRLRGLASAFVLALLTDRAFLIDWESPDSLTRYLIPNKIDWRWSAVERARVKAGALREVEHYWGSEEWSLGLRDNAFFRTTDLNVLFEGAQVVYLTTIYDILPQLRQNRLLIETFQRRNLEHFHHGLGCAFHYLFNYSQQLLGLVETFRREQLLSQWPIIAIHARVGDDSFRVKKTGDSVYKFEDWKSVFDCALLMEKLCSADGNSSGVRWFLATDNHQLKMDALERYGGRVASIDSRFLMHISFQARDRNRILSDYERRMVLRANRIGFQMGTFVDHLLLQGSRAILATGGSFSVTAHQVTLSRNALLEECELRYESRDFSLACMANATSERPL